MSKWRSESTLDLYKLVLGGFVFLSPWLFAFVYGPARLDAWVSGLILMAVSAMAIMALSDWEEWVALVLGLWLIAAPWVLGLPHLATKIHVGAGLVCAYLAGLELWLRHYDSPPDERLPGH
jgi:predicted MFS family arabinose efflux permease